MDRLPQQDDINDEDEAPYLAEETDYRELRFDGTDRDLEDDTDLERWADDFEEDV